MHQALLVCDFPFLRSFSSTVSLSLESELAVFCLQLYPELASPSEQFYHFSTDLTKSQLSHHIKKGQTPALNLTCELDRWFNRVNVLQQGRGLGSCKYIVYNSLCWRYVALLPAKLLTKPTPAVERCFASYTDQ